jgi:hypothetical protein
VPALAPRVWQRAALLLGAALAATAMPRVDPARSKHRHNTSSARRQRRARLYDVQLPFNPVFHPDMHAVASLRAFSAVALIVASRRSPRSWCCSSATWP